MTALDVRWDLNYSEIGDMTKQLTVYKASAGSGKTFTLAVEYISLLIENPQVYKNILAVTFTNKATEEMKERILSQLYGIWKGLQDSGVYLEKIKEKLPSYSENMIRERAGIALYLLIHHYHYFRIETIDSFFQSVLRNLAKELNLTANLHISLDEDQIEEQAVEEIIESFRPDDPMLLWLIQYIEDTIDEDKRWNVVPQLKVMGKNIFKDFYKKYNVALNDAMQEPCFNQYVKTLRGIRDKVKEETAGYVNRFYLILHSHGLTEKDFNSKSTVFTYFKRLKECAFSDKNCLKDNLLICLENPEAWVKKKQDNRTQVITIVEQELLPLLQEIESKRTSLWSQYLSATLILGKINEVRLLHRIEEKVREMNQEVNRFLLSDTQQLLNGLMKDSDTPFVFEKIGSQLMHVMIDEFQDTSNVQWDNFKVLLKETMSHAITGEDRKLVNNLIVGDVKQSIYRWRNSDWQLLNNITDQFPKDHDVLMIEPLDINYRSYTNIVKFNNHFFMKAAELEAYDIEANYNYPKGATALRSAYKEVVQKVKSPEKKEGYVNIQLYGSKDFDKEMMCEKIVERVDQLLNQGIQQSEIAILVRNKKDHVPMIANYFMDHRPDIHIISEEAFQLSSSIVVNTLIDALRVMVNTNDVISLENIKSTCLHYQATVDIDALFADSRQFLHLSLIDLVEKLYSLLQLSLIPDEGAYLFKFFDEVMSFSCDNGSDIPLFISDWEDHIKNKTIQTNVANGIQLISIHKSKGLEFPYLIIPFCDWQLELGDTVWFRPSSLPYNNMPIVPVKYSKDLMETVFKTEYLHEHLQNMVDNLNLLYVAFTRAKKCLFVIARKRDVRFRSFIIENVLEKIKDEMSSVAYENKNDVTTFEFGEMPDNNVSENIINTEKNIFTSMPEDLPLTLHVSHHNVTFKQSNKSKEFLEGELSQENYYIKMGNILHYLFSKIRTTDDIPIVLKELEQEGILYDEYITVDRLRDMLDSHLHGPRVMEWFSPRWTLYNECTILSTDEKGNVYERRPDRVMIDGDKVVIVDFKFGKFIDKYKSQIEEYTDLLRKMGYKNVSGYIWMVFDNKIVAV